MKCSGSVLSSWEAAFLKQLVSSGGVGGSLQGGGGGSGKDDVEGKLDHIYRPQASHMVVPEDHGQTGQKERGREPQMNPAKASLGRSPLRRQRGGGFTHGAQGYF